MYDVKPIFCSDWLAKDDSFTIEKDSITRKPLTISKQKLYSNDNYCFDKDIKFSITQFPNNGKLVISKNELIYYPDPISSNFEKDIFTYKICNEHNQCSQAYVKLTLNR